MVITVSPSIIARVCGRQKVNVKNRMKKNVILTLFIERYSIPLIFKFKVLCQMWFKSNTKKNTNNGEIMIMVD